MAQPGEDLAPFLKGHIVAGLAPHVARPAFAVAAEADADDQAKGQHFGPAQVVKTPVQRESWEEFEHG
jgi:hypothetical protein